METYKRYCVLHVHVVFLLLVHNEIIHEAPFFHNIAVHEGKKDCLWLMMNKMNIKFHKIVKREIGP